MKRPAEYLPALSDYRGVAASVPVESVAIPPVLSEKEIFAVQVMPQAQARLIFLGGTGVIRAVVVGFFPEAVSVALSNQVSVESAERVDVRELPP
ncbi:hypothetical protein QU24_04750 [Pantoea rodasii]|uniref:Uncharacterized protein n=1 Tax=Pantoea rodasii TaxID=1076549 RepID=A0A0B1RDE5_9GAMM|nr:hypothetical protein QU24_04750 [Pantoea rodasii]